MKILMVSPECYPFAKVGGLGDVVGALPKYLKQLGHDVRIILPLYGSIQPQEDWIHYDNITVHLGSHKRLCRVWKYRKDLIYYFVDYQQYFGSENIYACDNNGERFAFFSRAILDICKTFAWFPDVIHCHDWTTGLLPVFLNTTERESKLRQIATVFTIHNLEHQGLFSPDILAYAGIPFSEYRSDSLEALGAINFMKGALYHATKLTTVSPTYAQEIRTKEHGCGLDDVLRFKAADLIGILNGIDTDLWNPATDPLIAANFSLKNLTGKAICKQALQQRFGLPERDVPLFGVVSRLYHQKGLDVLMAILPHLFEHMEFQIVFLGNGEPSWQRTLNHLALQFPQKMRVYIGYDGSLAHQIEAGCDVFVMPSRFEPCGLNQMYSMRYGTLPLIRKTGGLADTVENLDEQNGKGCGFCFDHLTNDALYNTIGWACATYFDKRTTFEQMRQQAMAKDFSWHTSAKQYESVYQWAIEQRRH